MKTNFETDFRQHDILIPLKRLTLKFRFYVAEWTKLRVKFAIKEIARNIQFKDKFYIYPFSVQIYFCSALS